MGRQPPAVATAAGAYPDRPLPPVDEEGSPGVRSIHSRLVAGGALVVVLGVLAVPGPATARVDHRRSFAEVATVESAGTALPYADVCGDAGGSPLDLRGADIRALPDALDLTAYSCAAWADAAIEGRSVRWELSGGGSAPVTVVIRGSGGALTWTASSADSQPLAQGSAERVSFADARRGVRATVPVDALGLPEQILFTVSVHDDGDGAADRLPDAGEPPTSFPEACPDVRAVLRTERGRYGEAVVAARSAGLRVSAEAPGVSAFAVEGGRGPGALRGLPGIRAVERPVPVEPLGITPDDPAYLQQWALAEVNAPRAWQLRTGSALRVAVVDDGVDADRADLAGRVATGHDVRFDRPLPAGRSSDRGGHGTAVASVLAAQGDNGTDMAGVDWSAEIVPYRVFDAAGCTDDVHVAAAIVRAADDGAAVVNLSLGTPHDTPVLRDAVRHAWNAGTVLVAAVGNGGQTGNAPLYPAAYPEVVGVGATLRGGAVAPYSATGPHVHVVAPGGQGTDRPSDDLLALGEGRQVRTVAGTSYAVPIVSGAAALYRAVDPDAGPGTVAAALAQSASRGPHDRDAATGHGLVDIFEVVLHAGMNRACPPDAVPPAGFEDVAHGAVHTAAIDCLVWRGISRGVAAQRYAPGRATTRAQMATLVARVLEAALGPLPTPGDHFPDDDGNPHEASINALAEAGIVAGRDGLYQPNGRVTRDQMATFLVRAATHVTGRRLPDEPAPFADIDSNPHEDAIRQGFAQGLLRGRSATAYEPRAAVRRDQVASFLRNLLGGLARDGHVGSASQDTP